MNTTMHPIWMTAEDWLKSPYYEDWNYRGTSTPLFTIGEDEYYKKGHIKLITQLMFRVAEGWSYQPYSGPKYIEENISWIYCEVTDWSDSYPYLKSKEEVELQQLNYEKYCGYNWSEAELKEIGVETRLGRLTHIQLTELLKKPKNLKKFNKRMEEVKQSIISGSNGWYMSSPHIEKPVRIYVAGCDDSSYTEVVESVEEAMKRIESWKIQPPEDPHTDWPGAVFTN
jgi:hypothetical protein